LAQAILPQFIRLKVERAVVRWPSRRIASFAAPLSRAMGRHCAWSIVFWSIVGCTYSQPTVTELRHGHTVYLTTPRLNHRITAEPDGRVHANEDDRGERQRFVIERQSGSGTVVSGDVVLFKAWNGHRLSAPSTSIHAQWNNSGSWEQFVIEGKGSESGRVVRAYDTIFLKTHTGKRVDADAPNAPGVVQARYSDKGSWQELIVERPRCPGLTAENLASRLSALTVYLPVRYTWNCEYGRQPWTCRHAHYDGYLESNWQAYLYSDIDFNTHMLTLENYKLPRYHKVLGIGKAEGVKFVPGRFSPNMEVIAAVTMGKGTDSLINNPPTFFRLKWPSLDIIWKRQASRHAAVHTSWATPDNAHGLAVSEDRIFWFSAGSCTGMCRDKAGVTVNVLNLTTGEDITAEGFALPGVRSAKQMVAYNKRGGEAPSGMFLTASAVASNPPSLRFEGYRENGEVVPGPNFSSWGFEGTRQGVSPGVIQADPESPGFVSVWSHGADDGTLDKLYFASLKVSRDKVSWNVEPKVVFPDSKTTEIGANIAPLGNGRWLLAYTEHTEDVLEKDDYLFTAWEQWSMSSTIRFRGSRMAIIDSNGTVLGAPVNISNSGAHFPVEMNHLVERPGAIGWTFPRDYGKRDIKTVSLTCE